MIMHEHTTKNDKAPVSRAWLYDLPEGFSEVLDREDYLPYEPTPIENIQLNPYYHDGSPLQQHQQSIRRSHDILYAHPPLDHTGAVLVPGHIQDIVDIDRVVGQARRNMENMNSYADWVEPVRQSMVHWSETSDKYIEDSSVLFEKVNTELLNNDVTLIDLHSKFLTGRLRPNEVFYFLLSTSIRAAELAKVTHPYGYRIDVVSDAREAIVDSVVEYGGVIYPRVITPYERFHFDDKGLVTYKRRIAHVLDNDNRHIYVIERQSAGLNNLTEAEAEGLIQQDADIHEIIPLSTMWYAARETEEEYNTRIRIDNASGRVRKALSEQSMGKMFVVKPDGS